MTAVVEVPRREQIAEGQVVSVVRIPAGQNHVKLTGGHLGQPLFEDLFIDPDIQAKVTFERLLIVLGLFVGERAITG